MKKSSAQITDKYQPDQLVSRTGDGSGEFSARQIGPFMSEVLVLGVTDSDGHIVLIAPDMSVPNGQHMH